MEVRFDDSGLVPCVAQDWRTGEVLTLAYMNEEALARTRETSGNFLRVKALRYDCDLDAVLALVEPEGPACHTGERTCFHNGDADVAAPHEALPALERTVEDRRAASPDDSYTAELLADPRRIGAKVQEEAEEVARAAAEESDDRVAEEAADVLYHLAVLLASRGLEFSDAFEALNGRRR